jgi:hypothetical protein
MGVAELRSDDSIFMINGNKAMTDFFRLKPDFDAIPATAFSKEEITANYRTMYKVCEKESGDRNINNHEHSKK